MQVLIQKPRCPGYPSVWAAALKASHEVTPLRACALCMHSMGQQSEPELICTNPAVRIALHTEHRTCLAARATNGPCGPNAVHLDMRSWHTHRRTPSESAAA
jgi:hypothetical protein